MRLRGRWLLAALVGGAIFALLALTHPLLRSQHSGESSDPPRRVVIAVSTALNPALVKIADTKGFFRDEGLDAVLQLHTFGKLALQSLLEGKADLATVAETPIMFATMKSAKLAVLATIQTSTDNEAILARKDKGIASPEDLKGHRIGVTLGTTGDYFLDTFLIVQGLSRGDVELVDLKPEEMPDALLQGRVDAVSTWNPYFVNLRRLVGENGITFHNQHIYTETFNLVSVAEYPGQNGDVIRGALRALVKAEAYAADNPDESRDIMSRFSAIDRGLLAGIWPDFRFAVSLNQSLLFTLEDQARWAMRSGLADGPLMPDFFRLLHPEYLQSVKPEAVNLIR
ncbi:MAG: ABC transporter substrate-binding protein [Syntrophobacteraceae bacterium]